MDRFINNGHKSTVQSLKASSFTKKIRFRNKLHAGHEPLIGIDFSVWHDETLSKNLVDRLRGVYDGHFLEKQIHRDHGCVMIVKNLQSIPGSGLHPLMQLQFGKLGLIAPGDILIAVDGSQIVGEKAEAIISKLVAPRSSTLFLTFARGALMEQDLVSLAEPERISRGREEQLLVYSLSVPRRSRIFRYEFCDSGAPRSPAAAALRGWTDTAPDAQDGPASWDSADPPSESALSDVCSEVSVGPRAFLRFDSLDSPDLHTTRLVFRDNHLTVLQALAHDPARDASKVPAPPRPRPRRPPAAGSVSLRLARWSRRPGSRSARRRRS